MKKPNQSAASMAFVHKLAIATLLAFLAAFVFDAAASGTQPIHVSRKALVATPPTTGATCTSTDGKSTCVCGAKCQAKSGSCSCYGLPPSTEKKPGLSLAAPGGPSQATCTSGDGKKVCACGDQGCNAAPVSCGCMTSK